MRRATREDWALVLLVGVLVVGASGIGVARALQRDTDPGPEDGDAPPFFLSGAFGHGGDDSRAGVDPFAPPGLPDGVVIDRETGLMVGLDLPDTDGAAFLRWTAVDDSDYENGLEDVPESVLVLDGQPVVMVGFLKALYEIEHIRTFLLVGSHLACCFGTYPGPGGLVEVSLGDGRPDAARTVEPVVVTGRLRIQPRFATVKGRRHTALLYYIDDARVRRLAE